jgi:hypothetical protein
MSGWIVCTKPQVPQWLNARKCNANSFAAEQATNFPTTPQGQ